MALAVPGSQVLQVARAPAIIAHRGGNSAALAARAVAQGADMVEVDLWSYRQRLEARHERRVPRTPVLFERWYLEWKRGRHFALPDLLNVLQGRAGVLLDFKNRRHAARLVAEAMDATGGHTEVAASSQFWPILRLVHGANPRMEMFYSIDVPAQLDLFLSVVARDERPTGVSCNHRRLDRALVDRFHELGLAVIAWTVNDPGRAETLAAWGVEGITTDNVPAIVGRLRPR